ncbi:PilT-like protein [Beggiatoa sp. PS]|nr:PilT-like protein [Beggiatoa sp. PS]
MSKQDISNYTFSKNDRLFFDANIWIYIYGPSIDKQSYRRSKIYATALQKIRNVKSRLFIDALVLSEFINVYARLEYRQRFANTYQTFKQFRQSQDFKSVAQDIANNAKRIVKLCQPCDLQFHTLNLINILDEYAQGTVDYNDQLIAELCMANGLCLVTHDADFLQLEKSNHLILLTANQRLLNT